MLLSSTKCDVSAHVCKQAINMTVSLILLILLVSVAFLLATRSLPELVQKCFPSFFQFVFFMLLLLLFFAILLSWFTVVVIVVV